MPEKKLVNLCKTDPFTKNFRQQIRYKMFLNLDEIKLIIILLIY